MINKILYSILFVLGLIFLIPVFLPDSFRVERKIEIAASPDQIFPLLEDFQKWDSWSVWASADPNQKVTYEGVPGKPGHKQIWDGPINGKGTMTLDSISTNALIQTTLEFTEPQSMTAISGLELEPKGDKTTVLWYNEGKLDYPVGRYFGLFMDRMIGPDFEKGLANLKSVVESKK